MEMSLKIGIADKLKDLGIPANLVGYHYLKDAIIHRIENPSIHYSTCELYAVLAQKHDTTPSRVERGIRHAIDVGTSRGNMITWREMFAYSYSSYKGKPTNSEFICTLMEYFVLRKS